MVELSSLDVRLLALELRALEEGYVDKVYETKPGEFVAKIRHPQSGPMHLLMRPGAYVALATQPPASPETPTTVALTLRKLLTGARIRRVDQHEFDRVLRIQLERRGEPLELILELFGKGNLLVAGPDGTLLFVLRTETFAHRTIRRGEKLVLPPPRVNPATLPRTEFDQRVEASDKDTVRFLALDLALGGDLAEELVHRAGLDKNRKVSEVDVEGLDRLWSALRSLLEGPAQPAVASTVRGPQVQGVTLEAPIFRDAAREPVPNLSEAILRVAALETVEKPKQDDEAARLERQIVHQERGVVDLGQEADRWERRGHLLFAHYAEAAEALQKSKATIEATTWLAFAERVKTRKDEAGSWVERVTGVDTKRARILVKLEGEEIPLDPFASLEQNATILYDESKRVRAKQESAKAALADARKRLGQRVASRPAAVAKSTARAPTKRFWFDSLRWFYSSEGFLVVAGRDAASNEKLVKRHLGQGDRYAHADVQGAASVIVKCEKKTPGEPTLRQACQFAATHSKAFAQFAAADAYWVHPEQVSKTAESGEYVPKGAFVIRGTRNYFPKMKLELALGIVRLDGQGRPSPEGTHRRLMAGPPDAVRAHAARVALVERGDQKPTDAAKDLAPLFGVTLDEVVAALPPGTVRVSQKPEAHA